MKTIITFLIVFLFAINSCDNIVDENNNYDYSMEQKIECYCSQGGVWVKLFITADTVSSAIRLSDNFKLDYNNFWYYKSIKSLYDEISETDTIAYILIVEYDTNNIYPSFLYKEPKPIVLDDSTTVTIADAQISYTTQNYVKLKL